MMVDGISTAMQDKLMNIKSKPTYDKWWNLYTRYCSEKKRDVGVFSSFLDFFGEIGGTYKYSTLWQAASCINKYIKLKHGCDFVRGIV